MTDRNQQAEQIAASIIDEVNQMLTGQHDEADYSYLIRKGAEATALFEALSMVSSYYVRKFGLVPESADVLDTIAIMTRVAVGRQIRQIESALSESND